MVFIKKIRRGDSVYLAEVKSVREGSKIRHKFLRYIGKEINGKAERRVSTENIEMKSVKRSLDVLAVDKIAEILKIKSLIENKSSLALVYSQILDNKSINKLEEWFKHTEIPEILLDEFSTEKLYNSLTEINDIDFSNVEREIYFQFEKIEKGKNSVVIDVTDVYFEGKKQNLKPRRGKDEKIKRLLQVGLAVTLNHGFPIFHGTYHGNLSNIQIMKDMIMKLKGRHFSVVIMDRGMISKENLEIIIKLNERVIAGLKRTNSLKKYLDKISREEIFSLKNQIKLKNTYVYTKSFSYFGGKLIVVYNPSLEVVKKELNFEKGKNNNKYIGYSFIYHNTKLKDKNVVKKYYEKDTVERAFRHLKGILKLRPIRLWLREHVRGHVRICYLAYAILSFIDYKLEKLGISAVEALESLQYGYKATLSDKKSNFSWDVIVPLQPNQKKILKKIGVDTKN